MCVCAATDLVSFHGYGAMRAFSRVANIGHIHIRLNLFTLNFWVSCCSVGMD